MMMPVIVVLAAAAALGGLGGASAEAAFPGTNGKIAFHRVLASAVRNTAVSSRSRSASIVAASRVDGA